MTGARRLRFATGVLAITCLFACRQLVGVHDEPPSSGPFCGLTYRDTACGSCAETRCCAESAACARNSSCAPFANCLATCLGDSVCQSQCTVDHAIGSTRE